MRIKRRCTTVDQFTCKGTHSAIARGHDAQLFCRKGIYVHPGIGSAAHKAAGSTLYIGRCHSKPAGSTIAAVWSHRYGITSPYLFAAATCARITNVRYSIADGRTGYIIIAIEYNIGLKGKISIALLATCDFYNIISSIRFGVAAYNSINAGAMVLKIPACR